MEVLRGAKASTGDFREGSGLENSQLGVEVGQAVLVGSRMSEESSERQTVDHANSIMAGRPECKRVKVGAPFRNHW